jgi:hypothetical protein
MTTSPEQPEIAPPETNQKRTEDAEQGSLFGNHPAKQTST